MSRRVVGGLHSTREGSLLNCEQHHNSAALLDGPGVRLLPKLVKIEPVTPIIRGNCCSDQYGDGRIGILSPTLLVLRQHRAYNRCPRTLRTFATVGVFRRVVTSVREQYTTIVRGEIKCLLFVHFS